MKRKSPKLLEHLTCGEGGKLEKGFSSNHINWGIKKLQSLCTHKHFSLCNASLPSDDIWMIFFLTPLKALFVKRE